MTAASAAASMGEADSFAFAAAVNLWIQSIRHLCETLCTIPGTKSAAPLLNYACRTGNNALLVFCLQMQGTVLQVIQGVLSS